MGYKQEVFVELLNNILALNLKLALLWEIS